jgi:hypothetical protein
LTFLHPRLLFFAVTALLPVAVFLLGELRARRVRRAIGEPGARRLAIVPLVAALALAPALLALAAAEPVVESRTLRTERTGVEAFVVFDTSGSMGASAGPKAPVRLNRAKSEALALRNALPDVRFGIASMTDRTLPHLFPTIDRGVFTRTVALSIGVEDPPPLVSSYRATAIDSLVNLADGNFYTAPKRLAFVFTDGESVPVETSVGPRLSRAHIQVIFVHVWQPRERLYLGGVPDPNYRPDPASARALARTAALVGGSSLAEGSFASLVAAARTELGASRATTLVRSEDVRQVSLAKWFVLGAVVPLAFLLWRRNVPLELLRRARA